MAAHTARIDVIFDVDEGTRFYGPTVDALSHAADALGLAVDIAVVRTDTVDHHYFDRLPDAVFIGPGTPYRVPEAAELIVRTARERDISLVAT